MREEEGEKRKMEDNVYPSNSVEEEQHCDHGWKDAQVHSSLEEEVREQAQEVQNYSEQGEDQKWTERIPQ